MTEASWDELLGGESALLVRLGQLIFIWAKDTSIVKVVRAEEEFGEQVEVMTEVEVPPGLRQDGEPFMDFCREFVGADEPAAPPRCTNSTCEAEARKVIAFQMTGPCMFVAAYCDSHAEEVRSEQGGTFACGPALSDEARKIDGVRL
jgi:hypothetical protein